MKDNVSISTETTIDDDWGLLIDLKPPLASKQLIIGAGSGN